MESRNSDKSVPLAHAEIYSKKNAYAEILIIQCPRACAVNIHEKTTFQRL
jgi:hypothetical protein